MQTTDQDILIAALLRDVAEGNVSAMESLYQQVSLPLFRILVRMLKTEAIAEEALQETFVKIWENAHRFKSDRAAPMAWMGRIARNQAIDTLRYQKVRPDHDLHDDNALLDMLGAAPSADSPDNQALRGLLLNCLGRLTDKPRYCVVKAYVEGYSHDELSREMGSPVGTVKSWIRRSLLALKRCLDEHE